MKNVPEHLKITVPIHLKKLLEDENKTEYEFPSSLFPHERAFVHKQCLLLGLKSKSKGKGSNRFITVYKKQAALNEAACSDIDVDVHGATVKAIDKLLINMPLSDRERQELLAKCDKEIELEHGSGTAVADPTNNGPLALHGGLPRVPCRVNERSVPREVGWTRRKLPIASYTREILDAIDNNRVTLIIGETGCGKTTQVPQFILEDCEQRKNKCRIVCTQPRRIAAITMAERVAAERGEELGETCGYQIRLESRTSPTTLLTYCTTGVILRSFVGSGVNNPAGNYTHIIVDEVHERDRYTDYILILLRDLLSKIPHLKLVLMSADIDIDLFSNYFNGCAVVHVPTRPHDVTEYFLEDILTWTGYCNEALRMKNRGKLEATGGARMSLNQKHVDALILTAAHEQNPERQQALNTLVAAVTSGACDANAQHSSIGLSILMLAIMQDNAEAVEQLVETGCNPYIRTASGHSAWDIAKDKANPAIVDIMQDAGMADIEDSEATELLNIYHANFNDEQYIDYKLLLAVIRKVLHIGQQGAILVFLPGYEEIVTTRDRIMEDREINASGRFMIFTLHSKLQSISQKAVFQPMQQGVRKIVLATNIAEVSITIEDVVYVIDPGKSREKSFDPHTFTSSLRTGWISQESAKQRAGRAGRTRPGVCYRLYSTKRFESMSAKRSPEILRIAIHDLCLHAKRFAPSCPSVAEFLMRAPEAPSALLLRNATETLMAMDAMESDEELTLLGQHIAELPLEPHLGKMVLFAVVLKCLDPVLTIACALSHKNPFVLPQESRDKIQIERKRRELAQGVLSDHVVLLRAFQAWQLAKSTGRAEHKFCQDYFVSSSTMEVVAGIRAQVIGQLRASGFVRPSKGSSDIRDLNLYADCWPAVKAAIVAGSYPCVARVNRKMKRFETVIENNVHLHASSVVADLKLATLSRPARRAACIQSLPSDWLVYDELARISHTVQMKCVTVVSPLTIALFCGPSKLSSTTVKTAESQSYGETVDADNGEVSDDDGEEVVGPAKNLFELSSWLKFNIPSEVACLLMHFRMKFHSILLRRLQEPSRSLLPTEDATLRTLIDVLNIEDTSRGLPHPVGVGQRPRTTCKPAQGPPPSSRHTSRGSRSNANTRGFYRPPQLRS